MTQKLQPVRGTHDLLPEESRLHRHIAETAREITGRYGYAEIATPVFEFSEVFRRTLGDTSDVVSKETYSFTDRGGESLTLRPEFTAGVARAFITNGLKDQTPLKYFYYGAAFRYERPQKGRQRQFHQIGAELLGVAEPFGDIELIAMAAHVLSGLGLEEKIKLEINSLGDAESRRNYRAALVEFLNDYRAQLSEDSRRRLDVNPLRILDSKDEGDRKIIAAAPGNQDYFTTEAEEFFARVQEGLALLDISFYVNARLVRGLDYYSHTVFEFTTEALGAQNTVLAGGRYDGLIGMMGGPETAGSGWAAGVERLVALCDYEIAIRRPIAIIPIGERAEAEGLKLAQALRKTGFAVEIAAKGNAARRLKRADKLKARLAVMLGEEELSKGSITVRDLDGGTQESVDGQRLQDYLSRYEL